jgi:hypothetical protein
MYTIPTLGSEDSVVTIFMMKCCRIGGLKISEEEEVIRVLLADDHALFRKGLRQLLDPRWPG